MRATGNDAPSAEQGRREWIRHALGTLGLIGFGTESFGAEHSHAADSSTSSALDRLQSANWKPSVLTLPEQQTLAALSEAIIPGAKAANCDRVIDLLLTLEAADARDKLREALHAFDQQSQTEHGKAFAKATDEQQANLLQSAAGSQSKLTSHFGVVKSWVADVYWSSQQGMRELGFKGRVAWAEFPGCAHGGNHT